MRRPVLPGDVSTAARAHLTVPAAQRDALCRRFFDGAAEACCRVEREGRLHPIWGNGSLDSAARRYPLADELTLDDPEYLHCIIRVLQEILRRTG